MLHSSEEETFAEIAIETVEELSRICTQNTMLNSGVEFPFHNCFLRFGKVLLPSLQPPSCSLTTAIFNTSPQKNLEFRISMK